jgi:hypothetical protein
MFDHHFCIFRKMESGWPAVAAGRGWAAAAGGGVQGHRDTALTPTAGQPLSLRCVAQCRAVPAVPTPRCRGRPQHVGAARGAAGAAPRPGLEPHPAGIRPAGPGEHAAPRCAALWSRRRAPRPAALRCGCFERRWCRERCCRRGSSPPPLELPPLHLGLLDHGRVASTPAAAPAAFLTTHPPAPSHAAALPADLRRAGRQQHAVPPRERRLCRRAAVASGSAVRVGCCGAG